MTAPLALAHETEREAGNGQMAEAALTMPGLGGGGDHDRATAKRLGPGRTTAKAETKSHHPAHKSAKAEKPTKSKAGKSSSVALRGTFEDRTANYFDPLSLTLAPDARFDHAVSHYNRLDGSFAPADKGQIAIAPDIPVTNEITSAGIENLEKGNNHTIVVPLFQLLNKLSDQPPPQ